MAYHPWEITIRVKALAIGAASARMAGWLSSSW